MFDKCSEAIEEAEDNTIGSYNVMVTEAVPMEQWQPVPCRSYTAIYMRWCIGYLSREDQLAFLKKA